MVTLTDLIVITTGDMSYILLSSAKNDQESTRSFNEFKTRDELAGTIINYFEAWLVNHGKVPDTDEPLEYKSDDIYNFIDDFFGELCCLAKQEGHSDLWVPYTIDWIKESIFLFFRSQSEKSRAAQMIIDN